MQGRVITIVYAAVIVACLALTACEVHGSINADGVDGRAYVTVSEYVEELRTQQQQQQQQQPPHQKAPHGSPAPSSSPPQPHYNSANFASQNTYYTTATATTAAAPFATSTESTMFSTPCSTSSSSLSSSTPATSAFKFTDLYDLETEIIRVRDTFNGYTAAISVIGIVAAAAFGMAIAAFLRQPAECSDTGPNGDVCIPCGNPCGGARCKMRCSKKCGGKCSHSNRGQKCSGGGACADDDNSVAIQTVCNPHLKGDITTIETCKTFTADGSARLGAIGARAIANITEDPRAKGCYIVELAAGEKVPKSWCCCKTLRLLHVKDFCNVEHMPHSECYEIVACKECEDYVVVRAAPCQKPKVCKTACAFTVKCTADLNANGLVLYGKNDKSTCSDKVFVYDAWKNAWKSNIGIYLPHGLPLFTSLIQSCESCLNIVGKKIGIWGKDKVDVEACEGDVCLSAPKGVVTVKTPCLDLCEVSTAIKIPFERLIPCSGGGGGFINFCHLAGIRYVTWQNCPARDLNMVSDAGWNATIANNITVTAGGDTSWTSTNLTFCATDANGGVVFKGTTVDLCNFVNEVLLSKMRNCVGKPLQICAVDGQDIVVSTDGGDLNLCGVTGNVVVPFDRLVSCDAGPADLCALVGLMFKVWQNCTGMDLQMVSSEGWTANVADDVDITAGGDVTWTSANLTLCTTDASGGVVVKGTTVDLCNFVTETLVSKMRNCGANPLQICTIGGQDVEVSTDGGNLNLCGVTGNVLMPFDRLIPCVGTVADFCHLDGLMYNVWENCPGENLTMESSEGWTATTNGTVVLLNGGTNFTVQNETSAGPSIVTTLSRSTVGDASANITVDAATAGQAIGTLRAVSNALQRSQWTIQATNGNVTTQIQMRADVADTPARNIDFTSDDIDMCTNVTGNVNVRNLQICNGGSVLPESNNTIDVGSAVLRFGTIYGDVEYTPAMPANWDAPAPTNVKDALDRMAALLVVLNGGAIPV